MGKRLERDLGLPAVVAISIGAMVGSGIFILPALALELAGPAVILAYLVAGVLVLPAALAKSEMATAMPEAGGTYVYIERGMGPLLGTVAGVGTWFALSFKGALALVGGVPYLLLVFDLPVKPVALGLGLVLILVNVAGAKQTGRLQTAIVVVMLAALTWFVVGSGGGIDRLNYRPFAPTGVEGILAASGLVFVSYAGVTKIASVAEEIENPDRNIPLGILGSLVFTTILYVLVVAVMVGVVTPPQIAGTETPVAVAADAVLGPAGVAAVVLAAVLALVSTANAGILSSSRYPFAMSRDGLVPAGLGDVSERFGTPTTAITLTGGVLLALVAFVPILEIAKLASAFQILVFILLNVALVSFREGNAAAYDPAFRTPLYPAVPIFGVLSGIALLTQMGAVALVGAVLITAASVAWYWTYARRDVRREGAAAGALREHVADEALESAARRVSDAGDDAVLVAITADLPVARERSLVAMGAALAGARGGHVEVVRFDEVPDQAPLAEVTAQTPDDEAFEARVDELGGTFDVPVRAREVVSHDTKHAMVNYAAERNVDSVLAEHEPLRLRSRFVGDDIDWVVRHAPCDVLLVDNRGFADVDVDAVAVLAGWAPFDPTTVAAADALAVPTGATVTFRYPADGDRPDARQADVGAMHERLAELCDAPTRTDAVRTDGGVQGGADVVVRTGSTRLRDLVDDPFAVDPDCTQVTVYPHASARPGLARRLLERLVF